MKGSRVIVKPALMKTHVEEYVLRAFWCLAIEIGESVSEWLPLSGILAFQSVVRRTGVVDEAKTGGCEVERNCVRVRHILQRLPCDTNIIVMHVPGRVYEILVRLALTPTLPAALRTSA